MTIKPYNSAGSHRTGMLKNITVKEISKILGFEPNVDDDPDKVVNSWGFETEHSYAGIWDYKGSHKFKQFSTFGPDDLFRELFGERYISDGVFSANDVKKKQ